MNDQATDASERGEAGEASPGGLPLAQAIGTRNLLIIIITMPLVFLVVVLGTITIFGRPGAEREAAPEERVSIELNRDMETLAVPPSALQQAAAPSDIALSIDPAPLILPAGAGISSMAIDGDRLVLRVEDEGGGEIVIYDLKKGAPVQRIRVMEELAGDL